MKTASDVQVVPCIREMTREQMEIETARLFPLDAKELEQLRLTAVDSFVRNYPATVAAYLRGSIKRANLNREMREHVASCAFQRQAPEWRKAMGAVFDNHRMKWVTQAKPVL